MAYQRIVQHADIIEVYDYTKNLVPKRSKSSPRRKRRSKPVRRQYSLRRAKSSFFRLVAHNLHYSSTIGGSVSLVTLTTMGGVSLDKGYRYLALFIKNVQTKGHQAITYIGVPEWQKKSGNLHFHLIVFGLSAEYQKTERDRRNLQRLWGRGFVDIRPAIDYSPKIASYLAKYMFKASGDDRLGSRRSYSASRNVQKVRQAGSNSLSAYTDMIVGQTGVDNSLLYQKEYDTMWLGRCRYQKIKLSENANNKIKG